MQSNRTKRIHGKVNLLIQHFKPCLDIFDKASPFSKCGQSQYHQRTIQRRMELGSAAAALGDDRFLDDLHKTLRTWGIGIRGSRLLPVTQFKERLRDKGSEIASLDGLKIDDDNLNVYSVSSKLWRLVNSLGIVDNVAKIVPSSKALLPFRLKNRANQRL